VLLRRDTLVLQSAANLQQSLLVFPRRVARSRAMQIPRKRTKMDIEVRRFVEVFPAFSKGHWHA
jgi:hypothetical protein